MLLLAILALVGPWHKKSTRFWAMATAPDPLVWCSGAKGKGRRFLDAVRDFAMIPGPQRLWVGSWVRWPQIVVSGDDVSRWPFSPGALVKLAAFLSSLSWPGEVTDLGPGGRGGGGLLY